MFSVARLFFTKSPTRQRKSPKIIPAHFGQCKKSPYFCLKFPKYIVNFSTQKHCQRVGYVFQSTKCIIFELISEGNQMRKSKSVQNFCPKIFLVEQNILTLSHPKQRPKIIFFVVVLCLNQMIWTHIWGNSGASQKSPKIWGFGIFPMAKFLSQQLSRNPQNWEKSPNLATLISSRTNNTWIATQDF